MRLDIRITELGLVSSRERARSVIMAGYVFVNAERFDKPGAQVKESDLVELRAPDDRYVSRGGYKLERAIASFGLDILGMVCADIGASTGGFTDCMLQNGAARVYAVDVGYGQLDYRLRTDPRVTVLERTNARYLTAGLLGGEADFASVDVSFISLGLILPALFGILRDGGGAVCLIKPQFEAGRDRVGKNGVVRDPEVHIDVIEAVLESVKENGFTAEKLDYSPIKGPKGNIEYLIYIKKQAWEERITKEEIRSVVSASHTELDG